MIKINILLFGCLLCWIGDIQGHETKRSGSGMRLLRERYLNILVQITQNRKTNKSAVLLPFDECGQKVILQNKIAGGDKMDVLQHPWMTLLISMKSHGGWSFRCGGGSLISSRYILTAAHCIHSKHKITHARLGEHTISTPNDSGFQSIDVGVENAIAHENYSLRRDHKADNDIGLLRLDEDIRYKFYDNRYNIIPVCLLWNRSTQIHVGGSDKVQVGGWGQTENGLRVDTKRIVSLNVSEDPKKCPMISSKRQFCAGRKGKESCSGDSGNGAMKEVEGTWYVVGIVSYGEKGCAKSPGVYTRVGPYINWILSKLH